MNRPRGAVGARYNKAPEAEEVVWQLQGLCTQYDPEEFQPVTEMDAYTPKRICLNCPVVVQCREWALKSHEMSGVWGALSEADREEIWAGRRIRHRKRTA